jgi:phosphoglycerate dehydrogenase-like enzyme
VRPTHRKYSAQAVKLLFCGSGWLPVVDVIRAKGLPVDIWDRKAPLIEVVRDVDVLLPSNGHITGDVLRAAKQLRLIQQPAAGTEGIDKATAKELGIPVCNAPGTNHISVAEHALFLLLSLARRAPAAARAFANREVGTPLGIELSGKTLGIIGMGRSGTAFANLARALGMNVIALTRTTEDKRAFFAACDAISIHCPLNDSTRGLVGAEAFAAMKPGAFVMNLARGGVIDRDALVAALPRLGGVALDVHWHEPPDPNDALYTNEKVVAMPHTAGSTEEAFGRIADVVVENVRRLNAGGELLHRVA